MIKYDTFYSHSIINESDMKVTIINENDVFESVNTTIISNIQKVLGKVSGWIIDSFIDHNINISMYNPLAGTGYIKLPKKLDHPRE